MATFKYVAMDARGKESQGTMDAESQTTVVGKLREKGLFATSVQEVTSKSAKKGTAKQGLKKEINIKLPSFLGGRVKPKQLMVFTRQLSTLISSGLPLVRALRVLQKQERSAPMRKAITEMADSIETGSTFAEALTLHPKIFNKLYVNMVRAGEVGGVLDTVLKRLAEFQEKADKIKSKVVSAMVYPVVVLVMALGILTFLMIFIIPKFQEIFKDLLEGAALPPLTQFIMDLSSLVKNHFIMVAGAIAVIVVVIKLLAKTSMGSHAIDRAKLSMPVFGILVRKTAISRFARTLGTLMNSGVPVLQALSIVRETVGNNAVAKAVTVIHDAVKEGENMAPPIEQTKLFPPMVVSMVEVGEETGALPDMLMKVADGYDEDVDNTVAGLTSIIEPILIIGLAGIVGTIVIALFMPLVSIIGKLS